MKIRDLDAPVVAAKSDWGVATNYIGFTPSGAGSGAYAQCQSTVQRQARNGFVLEYITESYPEPNPGFETHPDYLESKRRHEEAAGQLIAIHKLRHSSRPLSHIIGEVEFSRLQDMWATEGRRHRWSVAFPIDETYEIDGHPKAVTVFGAAAYRRLFAHQSALLRELSVAERESLANLNVARRAALNRWIGVEDEIQAAELSEVDPRSLQLITDDLSDSVLEGLTVERRNKLRRRAAWLADALVRRRQSAGSLHCDACGFDPVTAIAGRRVSARSLLDVHHIDPIGLGPRYTEIRDLSLLCPNCHRLEHRLMDIGETMFHGDDPSRRLS